jgi:hypothetical protein
MLSTTPPSSPNVRSDPQKLLENYWRKVAHQALRETLRMDFRYARVESFCRLRLPARVMRLQAHPHTVRIRQIRGVTANWRCYAAIIWLIRCRHAWIIALAPVI